MKLQVAESYRDLVREFYPQVLGWSALPVPGPNPLLFQMPSGDIVGVFLVPEAEALTEAQQRAGTWLEIMTEDVEALLARLRAAGVKEVDYFDKTHVYFESPGGPIFRVAPESER